MSTLELLKSQAATQRIKNVCQFNLQNKTDTAKNTRQGELLLLSGEIMDAWFGQFVIELSSLKFAKERMQLNYDHNSESPSFILGHAENFRITDQGLIADSTIVLGKEPIDPIVKRVVELLDANTPFECSTLVTLFSEEVEYYEILKNESKIVNGRQISNAIVFQNVTLHDTTICSHGRDAGTRAVLLSQKGDQKMTKTETKIEPKAESGIIDNTKIENGANPAKQAQLGESVTDTRAELESLITLFGESEGLKLYRQKVSPELAKTYLELKKIFDKEVTQEKSGENKIEKIENKNESQVEFLKAELAKIQALIPKGETTPLSQHSEEDNKVVKSNNAFLNYAQKLEKKLKN